MWIEGHAWVFGDNVDTDQIMPARYLTLHRPEELAKHIMEAIDPAWPDRIEPGDFVVAGQNFGCGSSREHAPLGLMGAGVACIIARSFARIFYRNAINIGLPLIVLPEPLPALDQGAALEVDPPTGLVRLRESDLVLTGTPPADVVRNIIDAGGLMPYVARQLKPRRSEQPSS